MSSVKVNIEIGHVATLKSKQTIEGFTHDWEVFVRGQEGADISHFVDKVVFLLHTTFKKPRRVVKEPPFTVKESGYAGFTFPIELYLKNKDEPKKIQFSYDLTLQDSGILRDRYVFHNPNEEFRKKLLKGGGIPVSSNAFYSNPDQESRSRDSFSEEKPQLVSKPKLSSDNSKKHKFKEHKEEIPHKTSSFENLFGPPLQKPPKVSPDPKKIEKVTTPVKADKKEKERSSSDKKSKHEHKEIKPEKIKAKDEKEKNRSEKTKKHKDQERSKDKSNKRSNERPPSPDVIKKQRLMSPVRRPPSPPRSNSASSIKDEYKLPKHSSESIDQKKQKIEDKVPDVKIDKEVKEKKKKEKKSHDRDKDRKEKKEHKKESHKLKESPKEPPKEIAKEIPKIRDIPKEREPAKDSPTIKEKPAKPEKTVNKFSMENLRKTPENEDRVETHKQKDKSDPRKHKHKKKDKKRDESKDKHKESNKEKKHKHDKIREMPSEKVEVIERRETPQPKERPIPEPASPISIDTASQCSSKSGLAKMSQVGNEDANSSPSDSEASVIGDDEDVKMKNENISPELIKHEPSPEPEPELEPEIEPEPVAIVEPPPTHKEKSKKHKDKSAKREEKRRKRKAAEEERETLENVEHRKVIKTETAPTINDTEQGESSGTTSAETKVQDNGVSSSLGEDAEPGDLSPDYMVQLRDLQQRIMKIKNNEDLERVVNLIAETGKYEVTTQTFDFDLCLLDRSTVQQLIQMVGC